MITITIDEIEQTCNNCEDRQLCPYDYACEQRNWIDAMKNFIDAVQCYYEWEGNR